MLQIPLEHSNKGLGDKFFTSYKKPHPRNTTSFNQPIQNWDVSSVNKMESMFMNATQFNRNLSNWAVKNVSVCGNFSLNATSWTLPKPNFTNCTPTAIIYTTP